MPVNNQESRASLAYDDIDEVDYGTELDLDLELEKVIKHLDEAIADNPP